MCSSLEKIYPPVIDGIYLKQITFSVGFVNFPNSEMVIMKKINLPLNLLTKAEYVICDSDFAIVGNNCSCSIQLSTRVFMKVFL